MSTPYDLQPDDAFWRAGVSARYPLSISGLWRAKRPVSAKDKVVTAGSCFAQHISRALQARNFGWYNAEPAPPGMSDADAKAFGYGVFSFRTGNIYTASLLHQWVSWATEKTPPSEEVWEKDGRFFDPFRPVIEPNGFESADEVRASREGTIRAVRRAMTDATLFVFTMGLTEGWRDKETGVVYPMCPGTAAGVFDGARHVFVNEGYASVHADMIAALDIMRAINPNLRFLLTVSPVPLTATASDQHVLTATTYSKSVLRAVAGDLTRECEDVDYFPSYEIITGAPFRAMFYEPNLRSVAPQGVEYVMRSFFAGQDNSAPTAAPQSLPAPSQSTANDVACEEELLAR